MKRLLGVVLTLFMVSNIIGCTPKGYPVVFDQTEISAPPKRVVALSDNIAFGLSDLGFEEFIVGATERYINSGKSGVANISGQYDTQWEVVTALKPDLVISPVKLSESEEQTLSESNIPYIIVPTPENKEGLKNFYYNLSRVFKGEEKYAEIADTVLTQTNGELSALNTVNSQNSKSTLVFVEEGFVATPDTLAGELIAEAGIKNAAQPFKNYEMPEEEIKKADPQVIICPKGLSDGILKTDALKEITAVKSGAVYEVELSPLLYGTSGSVSVLKEITNYISK